MSEYKFPLGRVVATPSAPLAVPMSELIAAMQRHRCGDWGDVGEHDRLENELALKNRLRLPSVYHTQAGVKFYIITEANRSYTVLLPEVCRHRLAWLRA